MTLDALIAAKKTTIKEALDKTRILELRSAIVAVLAGCFPGVEARSHVGKLDIADIVASDIFVSPSFSVAITKQKPPENCLSGHRNETVQVTIFIVTEDMAIDGKRYHRDEIAIALSSALLDIVGDHDLGRWGLTDIGFPEAQESQPIFTAKSYEKGTVYYSVTFQQTLYEQGSTWWQGEPPPPMLGPVP